MTMCKNDRLTLAGLHTTIGLALVYNMPFEFCCPTGSKCGQYKYCSVCKCFVACMNESEKHDAYWWMNELKKYEEYMKDGRDHKNS